MKILYNKLHGLTEKKVEPIFGQELLIEAGSFPCGPHAFIYGFFTAIGNEGALSGEAVHPVGPICA